MRWLSVLSISVVLIFLGFGGYYVYYVDDRMSKQHDEKLRTLGSIARLFEGRLDSLTTVIRNTPYLDYRDLKPFRPVFTGCSIAMPECETLHQNWVKWHTANYKPFYKKELLEKLINEKREDSDKEIYDSISKIIEKSDCIRQEEFGYWLYSAAALHKNEARSRFLEVISGFTPEVPDLDRGMELFHYQECVARASTIERMENLPAYEFVDFKAVREKSGNSGTFIESDIRGSKDLRVTTVYEAKDTRRFGTPLWGEYRIDVKTSLEDLIVENPDPEEAFDKILLIDEHNKVLYQGGGQLPRFSDIESLIVRELEGGKIEKKEFSGYSNVHTVKLGDRTFHAYVHPLHVNIVSNLPLSSESDTKTKTSESQSSSERSPTEINQASGQRINWLAIGLVDESDFQKTTLAVSAPPLIIFVSLILIAILSVPFVKIVMIGKSEKVTTQDMRNYGLLGMALIGIVIILIALLGDYQRIGFHYSERLHVIGDQFSASLEAELEQLKREAIKRANERSRDIDSDLTMDPEVESNYLPSNGNISRLVFINNSGLQKQKFQKESEERTPSINVENRSYFSNPKILYEKVADRVLTKKQLRKNNRSIQALSDKDFKRFMPEVEQELGIPLCQSTLQSIRSNNTGTRYSMIGFPIFCLDEFESNTSVISAVVDIKTLRSFLPVGISYAIVNDDGLVLYHSEANKILDEKLFEEVQEEKQLRTMMSRSDSQMQITYFGQQYRLHHKPLDFVDGHLLILQDLSLTDAFVLQTTLASYGMFIGYVLVIALIMIGAILAYGSEKASWYWPDTRLRTNYVVMALILAFYTPFIFMSLTMVKGGVAFIILFSNAVLVISSLVNVFETNQGRCYERIRNLTAVFCGLSALILIVANVYVVYRYSWHYDRNVVATLPAFLLYCCAFALVLAWCYIVYKYRKALAADSWIDKILGARLSQMFHPIYRTRAVYYVLIMLVLTNLSVVPAVAIYRDARDAGLLTLLKIDHLAQEKWEEKSGIDKSLYFGGDYFDEHSDDRGTNGEGALSDLPPTFLTSVLQFTINNDWQQDQLDARSRILSLGMTHIESEELRNVDEHDEFLFSIADNAKGSPKSFLYPDIPGHLHEGLMPSQAGIRILTVITIVILTFLFVLFLRWFCRNVLGLYTKNQVPIHTWKYRETERNCLWLYPDEITLKLLEDIPDGNRFDIHKYINPAVIPLFNPADDSKPILVTHLEVCFMNPAVATQILYELEEQAYKSNRRLIVTSSVDPLPFLRENEKHPHERWSRLFSDFDIAQGRPGIPEAFEELVNEKALPEYVTNVVIGELGWHEELHRHLEPYLHRFDNLLEKQIIRLLANPQKSLCIHLWNLSTVSEKRVLYQLAKGNLINPGQWEIVLKLEARGLVMRDPAVRLASAGLERAILSTVSREESISFDRPEEVSVWGMVKLPLIVMLGLSGLFLFVTQKELFDLTVGAVLGAAVALPTITRFLALFSGGGSSTVKETSVA